MTAVTVYRMCQYFWQYLPLVFFKTQGQYNITLVFFKTQIQYNNSGLWTKLRYSILWSFYKTQIRYNSGLSAKLRYSIILVFIQNSEQLNVINSLKSTYVDKLSTLSLVSFQFNVVRCNLHPPNDNGGIMSTCKLSDTFWDHNVLIKVSVLSHCF